MTKRDLVLKIAEELNLRQVIVKKVVQKVFDHILEALLKGDKVELRRFGIFKIKERKARVGRNPRKPEQVVPVPPRKAVSFKPSIEMKKKIK
ncbi:MAG: integration host factor subunit beta [Candidatus Omnitrophica bacterium]|nr:integration host factor subunit beta [Candidatus Omnitrophota bacterium]